MLNKPRAATFVDSRKPSTFTRQLEANGDELVATINGPAGEVNEGTALRYLEDEHLTPADWEATHFRKIEYGAGLVSVKFSFRRRQRSGLPDLAELVAQSRDRYYRSRASRRAVGPFGFIVALGDTQFGKIDGDGVEGALGRCIEYLEAAKEQLAVMSKRYDIGQVHIALLGDHIEGFTSQGGANTWRTQLTLNEQIRLTRRTMMHAVQTFAQSAASVTVVAVPGNHGRVTTANGSQTRYDDSHDTESLIAVSDACALTPGRFGHVKFYVPETDEISVVCDVAGTSVAHVHGDRYAPGKHFDWWRGQAFGSPAFAGADVLMSGHYHGFLAEEQGRQLFLQVPALEAESTWWRHKKGTPGNPGLLTAVTSDGQTRHVEIVR